MNNKENPKNKEKNELIEENLFAFKGIEFKKFTFDQFTKASLLGVIIFAIYMKLLKVTDLAEGIDCLIIVLYFIYFKNLFKYDLFKSFFHFLIFTLILMNLLIFASVLENIFIY